MTLVISNKQTKCAKVSSRARSWPVNLLICALFIVLSRVDLSRNHFRNVEQLCTICKKFICLEASFTGLHNV